VEAQHNETEKKRRRNGEDNESLQGETYKTRDSRSRSRGPQTAGGAIHKRSEKLSGRETSGRGRHGDFPSLLLPFPSLLFLSLPFPLRHEGKHGLCGDGEGPRSRREAGGGIGGDERSLRGASPRICRNRSAEGEDEEEERRRRRTGKKKKMTMAKKTKTTMAAKKTTTTTTTTTKTKTKKQAMAMAMAMAQKMQKQKQKQKKQKKAERG
jgi:hypothetical protein